MFHIVSDLVFWRPQLNQSGIPVSQLLKTVNQLEHRILIQMQLFLSASGVSRISEYLRHLDPIVLQVGEQVTHIRQI